MLNCLESDSVYLQHLLWLMAGLIHAQPRLAYPECLVSLSLCSLQPFHSAVLRITSSIYWGFRLPGCPTVINALMLNALSAQQQQRNAYEHKEYAIGNSWIKSSTWRSSLVISYSRLLTLISSQLCLTMRPRASWVRSSAWSCRTIAQRARSMDTSLAAKLKVSVLSCSCREWSWHDSISLLASTAHLLIFTEDWARLYFEATQHGNLVHFQSSHCEESSLFATCCVFSTLSILFFHRVGWKWSYLSVAWQEASGLKKHLKYMKPFHLSPRSLVHETATCMSKYIICLFSCLSVCQSVHVLAYLSFLMEIWCSLPCPMQVMFRPQKAREVTGSQHQDPASQSQERWVMSWLSM